MYIFFINNNIKKRNYLLYDNIDNIISYEIISLFAYEVIDNFDDDDNDNVDNVAKDIDD